MGFPGFLVFFNSTFKWHFKEAGIDDNNDEEVMKL